MFNDYANFDLHLFDYRLDEEATPTLRVQVERSPAGLQDQAEHVVWPSGLEGRLQALDTGNGSTDTAALQALGRELAALLLPPVARRFFNGSRSSLPAGVGLRVRIRCSHEALDALPWELAYFESGLEAAGSGKGAGGFLSLDTSISIVRREAGPKVIERPVRRAERPRFVAVMCEPASLQTVRALDLARERANLQLALGNGDPPFELVDCTPTRQALQIALFAGADVFHFAGHGATERGETASLAWLYLQDADGQADRWAGDDIAVQLSNRGIQLAMLGACCSARTDGSSFWAGIAPSLVRGGIPAVIGMQYPVGDDSTVEFSRVLYTVWPNSMLLDEAVTEARRAVRNLQGSGADFATAVLYMSDGGLPQPEPMVVPGRDKWTTVLPPDGPPPADVDRVLNQLLQLHDCKCVHDALHDALTRDFKQLQEKIETFPQPRALRGCKHHAEQLERRLAAVRRVAEFKRCGAQLLDDIVGDFAQAMALLMQAIDVEDVEKLLDAERAFESFFMTQLPKVDTAMKTLSENLGLDALIAFLAQVSRADRDTVARQRAELQALADRLRSGTTLHSGCQSIDSKLAVIRRAGDGWMRELRSHYPRLSPMLDGVVVEWRSDERERLLESKRRLEVSVAGGDKGLAHEAFLDLCDAFDQAFYRIDTDFKELCGHVHQPTHPVKLLTVRRWLQ